MASEFNSVLFLVEEVSLKNKMVLLSLREGLNLPENRRFESLGGHWR